MRNIRLVVEYDGTGLCGWQRQINGPTVQGHLEDALATLLAHPVTVAGASRTDAGVHARGQVSSFRTERTIPVQGMRRALNTLLPPTIAIRDAAEVDDQFHPRFSATGKHYRYLVLQQRDRSPRWRDRAWHLRGAVLDRAAMTAGANSLLGVHDFEAFRAAGCSANSAVRRIDSLTVSDIPDVGDGLIGIDVRGNAFLRNMVRIIVGTLVEVGTGERAPAQVAEILAGRDRTRAGITAPPQGLELVEVSYDGTRKPLARDL